MQSRRRAFTLVEVMVVLIITGIIILITSEILQLAEKQTGSQVARSKAEEQLQGGMDAITDDMLRSAFIDPVSDDSPRFYTNQLYITQGGYEKDEKGKKKGPFIYTVHYGLKKNTFPTQAGDPKGNQVLFRQSSIQPFATGVAREPVAIFIDQGGFQVTYFDASGAEASTPETVQSLCVMLKSTLPSGDVVQKEQYFRLSGQQWYIGGLSWQN